ncbi:hypothetical protein [Streptomyces sp. NPDC058664]|uniref:hypothetical protein n=1 Tax=unclassified Streptomyces TaxID=2593676 RepID=UPI00366407ED
MEADQERKRSERVTEGLVVAVASVLSLGLLAGPTAVLGMPAWHLVTDTGVTAFGRLLAPLICLALVASPLVLALVAFRSRRREGGTRLTAAVPAVLTLLGASVVPLAALFLIVVYAN